MSLSWGEMALIFLVALLVFGPRKLPELGRTLGKGLREFKKASDDLKSQWDDHMREAEAPVQDLKHSIREVREDVEASVQDIETSVIKPEDNPVPTNPDETKPDVRPN